MTRRPHVALPLGGIGTGSVAIGADGGLRQWQLHNIGNHAGALPWSFFAIRASRWEPPLDVIRVLQQADPPASTGTPLVTDDVLPQWQHELLGIESGVAGVEFDGLYPTARLTYHDDELPVDVSLEATNPLVPLDVDTSSLPATMFTFTLRNPGEIAVHGSLAIALQNAVGWDGITPIDGVNAEGYGGNVNEVSRRAGWTSVDLRNPAVPSDDPRAGTMLLAADDAATSVLPAWRRPEEFVTFLRSRALAGGSARLALAPDAADPQRHAPHSPAGPSPEGTTWNCGLAVPFQLEPGAERTVRVALTWCFPNRYVDFEQFGPDRPEWGLSRFWLGNHYATRFPTASAAFEHVRANWSDLATAASAWADTLCASSLDDTAREHLAAQLVPVRTQTCFRSADGRFFGFEGLLGASTTMWSGAYGGSCPLNCTHVWNYAQAAARVFPELERSMRDTEWSVMQAPEGYLPHRVVAPTYLRQFWDEPIGGPEEPALDGMLGAVLKTYREHRGGAGQDWLRACRPSLVRLMDHVERTWADADTGLLSGIQPSTHDIDLTGWNSFQGTLWLAALRAMEAMCDELGEPAEQYRTLFERASASYDELLFDGEYYVQRLAPDDNRTYQWGQGCLSDQLIGQWWAHQLGLGYLLPREHVRSALRAVVRHNLRHGFRDQHHPFRIFADADDTGLVMCTWPRGGRPDVPLRYADEVWTGTEYQVAAHCLWEGMTDEADAILTGLWARYDGTRRNPYNEIECGDHYVRAMAGWSVLDAWAGMREHAAERVLDLRVPDQGQRLPVVLSTGFGLWSRTGDVAELACTGGHFELRTVRLDGRRITAARMDGRPVQVEDGVVVTRGSTLQMAVA